MNLLEKIRAYCKVKDLRTNEERNQICHFCRDNRPEHGNYHNYGMIYQVVEDVYIEDFPTETYYYNQSYAFKFYALVKVSDLILKWYKEEKQ